MIRILRPHPPLLRRRGLPPMPRMMVPGRAQLHVRQRPALVQRVLPHRVPGAEDEAEAAEDAEDDGGDVDHFFSFSGV